MGAGPDRKPVYHPSDRWYTLRVPTARPRFQVTDTGSVRAMLIDADVLLSGDAWK